MPSMHRVQLAGGPAVWAMCAIDLLGIPQMADRDATIIATDPRVSPSAQRGQDGCVSPHSPAGRLSWSFAGLPRQVCGR